MKFRRAIAGSRLLMLAACPAAFAAVNDIFPADYAASPTGTTTVALYAFDRKASGPYRGGRELLDARLDTRTWALRVTHAMQFGDTKVSPLAVLSGARLSLTPEALATVLAPEPDGYGDLRVGATVWLVDRPQERHWLGVTGVVIAPTGSYHAGQSINVGENRWRFVLTGGWIHPLFSPNLLLELSPEIVRYGDNQRYLGNGTLAQDTSYALTGYLRHRITPSFHGHLGWQDNRGGGTRIDGAAQDNEPGNRRFLAGFTWISPEMGQVIFRYARDTRIDNGFKLDREIALRWMKGF